MKIRSGFVSNSSSSSFIIAGDKILEILKKFINDCNMVNYEPEWYKKYPDFSYGDVVKEIISQCKNSTEEYIKSAIGGLVFQSVDFYVSKVFHKIIPNQRCVCFMGDIPEHKWYNKFIKGTEFDLPEEFKKKIENAIKNQYEKTGTESKWDYRWYDDNEYFLNYNEIKQKFIDKIYNNFKSKYKEMYVVSFGDNHGECSGRMGAFVEYDFLGNASINSYMKSNFVIYQNNEH